MFIEVRQPNIPEHSFLLQHLNKNTEVPTVYNIIAVICIECSPSSTYLCFPVVLLARYHNSVHSAKAIYVHLCYLRGVFIIQRAFTRQRCDSDTKLISGDIIYS